MNTRRDSDAKPTLKRGLNKQVGDQVTGTWTDPALSAVTFGTMAEKWYATKQHRAPKTVAGYRSLLDTIVMPRWKDTPLRDVRFEDLQEWSVASVRTGRCASRARD